MIDDLIIEQQRLMRIMKHRRGEELYRLARFWLILDAEIKRRCQVMLDDERELLEMWV